VSKGRKPDYKLKAFNPETKRNSTLGVGWNNENGSVSISVDEGCVLGLHRDLVYNLWPIKQKEEQEPTDEHDTASDDGRF